MTAASRRRTWLLAAVCSCLSLVTLVATPGHAAAQAPGAPGAAASSSDHWGQQDYDTRRRSFEPGRGVTIGPHNAASLHAAWSVPADYYRPAAISAGRVFTIVGGRVVAARVADGSTLWSYRDPAECPSWNPYSVMASPTRVFVYFDDGCSITGATDAALVAALDASTGRVLWQLGPSQWVW